MKTKKSKKIYYILGLIILVGIATVYFIFGRGDKLSYDFVIAERGDIVQEVSATGRVKPAEDVDLAFEKTGRVSGVYVDVGDRVYKEQLLVKLSNSDVSAQLDGAKASLKAEQAKFDELKKGTRPEEIEVQKVKVENTKIALEDTKKNLEDKLNDAYTKADDAIRNKIDQFFSNPRGDNPQLNFQAMDSESERGVEDGRLKIESVLIKWGSFLVEDNLNEVKDFLDQTALLINSLVANSNLSQATIDGWKTDVSTARTNINTAIANLTFAREEVRIKEAGMALALEELALIEAGAVPEQVTAQEAKVEKAQADVKKCEAELAKTILRSPIKGMVTKQNAEVGESVSANSSLVSVISESNFEIEADIPEVDVAKIKLGDTAKVTLDAYGDDVLFSVVVVAIDPAETMIEGVPSYKTTLQFKEDDARIRSGMTANLDILTDRRNDVIFVPQRAVITKNGSKFARVLDGETIVEKEVKTGLRNAYGDIEIVEGINEGDKVITFLRHES